jgi:hypothetical protein
MVTNPGFKVKVVKMGHVPEYRSQEEVNKLVTGDDAIAKAP